MTNQKFRPREWGEAKTRRKMRKGSAQNSPRKNMRGQVTLLVLVLLLTG